MTSRKTLIVAGLALLLVLAVFLALPWLIDVNQYRGLIQEQAEQTLGRRVTLGEMSLSLFPSFGIRIQDPEVEGMLRARSVTVGVHLLPLLFGGGIELRKVVLDAPEITMTRAADGTWDIQDVARRPAAPEKAGDEAPGRPFDLARLLIREGKVHLRGVSPRSGVSPLSFDLDLDLDGSLSGSGAGDLAAEVDGELREGKLLFDLRGSVQRAAPAAGGATEFDIMVDKAVMEVARARELAAAFGQPWPLPEGLVRSKDLSLGGRVQGRLANGALERIDLTDVVVTDADLLLARDASGRWNFESLGAAPRDGPGGATAEPLPLTVKNLRLAGVTVGVRDEATGAGKVDLVMEDLSLVVEELRPGRPLEIQLETRVKPGGGSVRIAGTVPFQLASGPYPPGGLATDARVAIEDLDAGAIGPWLAGLTGLRARGGRVGLSANLEGSYPEKIRATGKLELEEIEAAGVADPVTAKADFAAVSSGGGALIEIEHLDVALRRSGVSVRGTLRRQGEALLADLELPAATIDAADLPALLALTGAPAGVECSSTNPVHLQARLRGDLRTRKDLELSGSLEVKGFTFRHPGMSQPMEQVIGTVALRRDGFDVTGFSGIIGRSDVAGRLSVSGLDAPRVTFDLKSRRADFWELMSFLEEKESAAGARTKETAPARPAGGDYLSTIRAQGSLSIGEGSFGTLEFSDLGATMTLDGRVVTLDPVAMKLYGGAMSGSASMDMNRDPALYSVTARATGIDSRALLEKNLGMSEALSGTLSGEMTVSAAGATRDAVLSAAKGGGRLRIDDGHIGRINVLKVLSRVSDLMRERSLEKISGRLAKEGTDFSVLTATLNVAGGKVATGDLLIQSPDIELRDEGSLDLLAGTLRATGQVIFSQALSQAMADEGSKAADYFWDDRLARVNLPLRLSGPLASPTPDVDWSTAGRRLARRKAEETVREKLEQAGLGDLIGGTRRTPAPARTEPTGAAPETGGAAAPEGSPAITIEQQELGGSLLLPDLKIRGTLKGTAIASATVRVTDGQGRTLHEESLMEKVTKYYGTHDRSQPAAITFRVTVDGRKMVGVREDLRVEITVQDAAGGRSVKSFTVAR